MAKSTTKPRKPKSKPAGNRVLAASTATSAADVTALFAGLPELTADERAGFQSEHDEASCIALGGETKSGAIRACAIQWIAQIKQALAGPHAELIGIDLPRVRWMVELVAQLDAQRATASGKSGAQAALRTTRDLADAQAADVRKAIGSKLERIARNTPFADQVSAARGSTDTVEKRAQSLGTLADIADKLISSRDAQLTARVRSRKLTQDLADRARSASKRVLSTRGDVALGTVRATDRDPPEVNAVEGRLSFELVDARDEVDAAIEAGAPLSPLVPMPGTQNVLARNAKSAKAPPVPTATDPNAKK